MSPPRPSRILANGNGVAAPERTVLQLTQKDLGDWLELHGRKFYREVRDDLRADLRTQDARWQSLNARVATLGNQLATRLDAGHAELEADLRSVADALYALRNELQVQRAAHRDPFGVLAALLRDLRPSAVRVGHAIWPPRAVDAYLRATWRLRDPDMRAYKGTWRDAKLIGRRTRDVRPQVHRRAGRRRLYVCRTHTRLRYVPCRLPFQRRRPGVAAASGHMSRPIVSTSSGADVGEWPDVRRAAP